MVEIFSAGVALINTRVLNVLGVGVLGVSQVVGARGTNRLMSVRGSRCSVAEFALISPYIDSIRRDPARAMIPAVSDASPLLTYCIGETRPAGSVRNHDNQ